MSMAMLCPDKLLPPTTPTTTLTVLGPDGFAAGKNEEKKIEKFEAKSKYFAQ